MSTLRIRAGARFDLTSPLETAAVFIIRPEMSPTQLSVVENWITEPFTTYHDYYDIYGNRCRRVTLPAGSIKVAYDVLADVDGDIDPQDLNAAEIPVPELPDDALVYTLPSRYCHSDLLAPKALELFGGLDKGWSRVQAIVDYVHNHVRFQYGTSNPQTSALDVFENAVGVCRDFAHLAIAFCRAMNIPARYAFGYLPDIDVPPPDAPMDFCAWFEAYLGGRWWLFDPRNNQRRRGRVTIARGRDALDVAMLTTYGATILDNMEVIADPVEAHAALV